MSRRPNLEIREKILCAAYKLMYTDGFKGVSMDDVAQASGVKKANLFHYYPTKESLGLAVFDHAVAGFQSKLATRIAGAEDPLCMVRSLFDQAAEGMRERCCAGGCFVGNMAQELSDYNEPMRQRVAQHLRAWAAQLGAFLADYKARGFFRSDFNPQETAQAIIALFEGAMLVSKAHRETVPLESAKALAIGYLEKERV